MTYSSKRDQDYYTGPDAVTKGGLRDNYAYVHTPMQQRIFTKELLKCVNGPSWYLRSRRW